jgi:outer membrane protein assembly factor BamB
MSMCRTIASNSALILLFVATNGIASDWPTYRHDIARTGCTEESLSTSLAARWTYTAAHEPKPAWPGPGTRPREGFILRDRVNFDDAFQVVIAGGRLYFGSSIDDKVHALSTETGEEIWSFCTGGPIRLAPALWNGRVFVGSDDGLVYCLSAETGELVWKARGGPADEKLLGSGRMISRWPIRTGVLVDDGIAYFGAGIFPHEDVYLLAVRADDGTIVWRNGTISQAEAYRNDLSPQGYLLATPTRLFVPSGRALPVGLDKATGRLAFKRDYGWRGEEAGGVPGGTYALLADNQLYTGTQEHLLALNQETGKAGFAWFPGRRLTVSGTLAYMATGQEIRAMDRTAYAEASRRRNSLEFRTKTLQSQLRTAKPEARNRLRQDLDRVTQELAQHNREKVTPTVKWHVASPCDAELIVCENLVLAGGQDEVCALDRSSGNCVWRAKVEGRARSLAVAGGRLYASTDKGRIYCFAAEPADKSKATVVRHNKVPVSAPYPEDELTPVYRAAAEAIVMESGVTKGYCLVLGAEQGRLAFELAKRTNLHIIGVEPDPVKVKTARAALAAAGIYGSRVVIDQGELSALPYSDYFANLIVSDRLLLTGRVPGDPSQLTRHLKPCGGTICLGVPAGRPDKQGTLSADELTGWLDKLRLGRCRIGETNGLWAILKRGALPGAGQWTHQYAEAGNTACSNDRLLGGSLGLLWFGEPGQAPMVNRHDAAAAPLAVNGRLFIQGENIVMAYDSYNGALLWQRDIPGAMRTRLKALECGNLAASEDSFFVALRDKCLRLDAETGTTRAVYPLPAQTGSDPAQWGFLACADGILYGSTMKSRGVSDKLFALDSEDGRILWQHEGKNIVNLTLALGDGWLFFIDSSLTLEQREQILRQDKSPLKSLKGEEARQAEQAAKKLDARRAVALDARTGGKLWETPVDVTDCSRLGIGGGELTAMYHNGVVVLCGANANGHYWRQFLAGEFSQRRLVALSGRTGEQLWACDANYRHRPVLVGDTIYAEPWAFDLQTGRQKTRPNPISGIDSPWQFLRPGHHCGAVSACPQMLLMRSGFTAYYDLQEDSGIRHFAGQRPGCWINAIAADGLALIPEASAGCLCLIPITCSLALEPRPDHYRWGIYSAGGAGTPVQHLAINFGAPGDMRDAQGTLWFGYPRPTLPADRAAMGLSFPVQVDLLPGGEYVRCDRAPELTARPQVGASYASGFKRCVLPLRGDTDEPAVYTVRLHFPHLEDRQANTAAFDVKLQGDIVAKAFNPASAPGNTEQPAGLEFSGIRVDRNLELELICSGGTMSQEAAPVLSGLEVVCTSEKAQTDDRQVAAR